jgi:hypothetical protein
VVVLVGGVVTIHGDGNTVCKAKDHSRDALSRRYSLAALEIFLEAGESSHARESRMR